MTDATTTKIEFEKATIYTTGEFMGNIIKVEVRRGEVKVAPYAQHTDAVHVRYVPKGKRNERGFVKSFKPFVLVLEGHGHPDADSLYGYEYTSEDGEVTTSRGRHRSFDAAWVRDFRSLISAYINKSQGEAKVVFSVDEELA